MPPSRSCCHFYVSAAPELRRKVITVVGATGNQSRGVVAALLGRLSSSSWSDDNHDGETEFVVRAVTSNPTEAKARTLVAAHPLAVERGQFSLVHADLADSESLERAFVDTDGVFFVGPFMSSNGAQAEESEEARLGRNVVDAAKACVVKNFIYLVPEPPEQTQRGQVRPRRARGRESDRRPVRASPPRGRHAPGIPPAFYSNLAWPLFARREGDGTVAICVPVNPVVRMEWVDDGFDIGNFAAA